MTNEVKSTPPIAEETATAAASESSLLSRVPPAVKALTAALLLFSAVQTYTVTTSNTNENNPRRRLDVARGIPSFVEPVLDELRSRIKLFEDTPPEEVKYWFEYTGPLQKYFYRYSKSRGKADYFEGRDDSGVISSRLVETPGGGGDFAPFYHPNNDSNPSESPFRTRLSSNCQHMGHPTRPSAERGTFWHDWFGSNQGDTMDRCRVLFVMNMVGAGQGSTILWETPPPLPHEAGPRPWQSEQETAAMHLERNLREIDAMCATGQIAARVQVLVCEPIPGIWTDWMDGMLVNCGGKKAPLEEDKGDDVETRVAAANGSPYDGGIEVEDRASPIQVVVVASAKTADTCHDLKSGFMEQRMQDLVLAPPYLGEQANVRKEVKFDPSVKTTHPDLISSDDHDLYVALKWSSLVTTRAVSGFLQASADLAAASVASNDGKQASPETKVPNSNFLIPSFLRVSYVSEENTKVAKWRMHGDFFHPAAWEICKDSFEMTFLPYSLSSHSGVNPTCPKELDGPCGQWWVFFTEEQMSTAPEVYANENTFPLVRGGSNFFWMLTERQRKEIVKSRVCRHELKENATSQKCGDEPQAVIPLGDLQSFLVNFMPNTALGKKHEKKRRPGYSQGDQLQKDREQVRERKQLKGQEEIEKALFDYTVYPAALFHKDATIKAARDRDTALTNAKSNAASAPKKIKSAYYDVTITKPRDPTLSWCQHLARRGLCALYADYFREGKENRCYEACGMKLNWTPI